jgi:Ala-tRNA(Pro) deacylase
MNFTDQLRAFLISKKVSFKEIDHDPGPTCKEAAKNRGEDLRISGKTLLFKDKKDFRMFVLSGALQVDSNKVRKILRSQRLRFATDEEFLKLTGVPKGALPPIGRDFLPFDLYLDLSILENDKIAFNAGILTKSFILPMSEYLKAVKPKICLFSKL